MSDNIKPVELSAEELDNVAGGAFKFVKADNDNRADAQVSATILGAKGGITSLNTQETVVSHQSLDELTATGLFTPTV